MVQIHNLGFPRIGPRRELKLGLEKYWRGESCQSDLLATAKAQRQDAWQRQAALDLVPVGDFSLYDHVLDLSFLLGNVPERVQGRSLDDYFRIARGRSACDREGVAAGEMTKWFDTNYHFIVPEFSDATRFEIQPDALLERIEEARALGLRPKPVLLGPLSYLYLGKSKSQEDKLTLLPALCSAYQKLLGALREAEVEWVQIDEPVLAGDLDSQWQAGFRETYEKLSFGGPRLLLANYFGALGPHLELVTGLPVHGLHVDAVRGRDEVEAVLALLPESKILSLGVVDGRNIWRSDLNALLDWLEPIAQRRGETLWLAPSCSLLHVPVDLNLEDKIDSELRSWLCFATQKLEELTCIALALNQGRESVAEALIANAKAQSSRRASGRVHRAGVKSEVENLLSRNHARASSYEVRRKAQAPLLGLPDYPTTTIGSFPQTPEIRKSRREFRRGEIDEETYRTLMQDEIRAAIRIQEELELDVLVHGEAERNDMVEYFGQQLLGFAFTENGWVQSYGSRCVKPPILYGDVERPKAMTVEWTSFAQSLTDKPVKGMLTGPVTILNWSFVRDDQPRSLSCAQIALALRREVLDLEGAGTRVIQIDEAALREGLPLRRRDWEEYLTWAVDCFRATCAEVADTTQIHTHMCYSEFNDIIEAIARLDADVITIETSRSQMELLGAFDSFEYPNAIGPGVYDIHSPNVPTVEEIVKLMRLAATKIPSERLWVNPDCGLKTRAWHEVKPALLHLVAAAKKLRGERASSCFAVRGV